MLLTLFVLLPFLGSIAAAFLPATGRNLAAWLAGSIAAGYTVLILLLYPAVEAGGVERIRVEWLPQFGLVTVVL